MNIAVLLSGGVDSSVVVHLLCEQGYRPSLFYIKIGRDDADYMDCSAEEDMEMASAIARRYGLSLEVVDLHREYWDQVAAYAIDKIRRGLTPNPDVMCNKLIKFGCFDQRVGKDFDITATGHYATTVLRDGKTWLGTAADSVKDQTDFLAQIDYLQVSKLMFPLGRLMKNEVRDIALRAGLPSARRRDSQGICFLGKIDYNDFVRRFLGEREGDIVELETGRKLGKHRGYWFHTIGQRKGLGLGGGPWFVVRKDVEENVIYVSRGCDTALQYGYEFRMYDFHFITDNPWKGAQEEVEVTFKIRHTPEFVKGRLQKEAEGYRIVSEEKLQGIAPGQFGVVYDADARLCVGSGIYAGVVVMEDELKDDAVEAIRGLKQQGIRHFEILSGDKTALVQNIAHRLDIRHAYGDLLPADKVARLQKLKDEKHCVAFVGDGINDAPVLALSDVGIAMGGLGSDIAIETADVIIQDDSLSKLVTAVRIGKYTRRIIWQNIILAFLVKFAILALGTVGVATLWEAVFADSGVALLAIFNAMRINRLIKHS
mgnify:CR=1 FL=1